MVRGITRPLVRGTTSYLTERESDAHSSAAVVVRASSRASHVIIAPPESPVVGDPYAKRSPKTPLCELLELSLRKLQKQTWPQLRKYSRGVACDYGNDSLKPPPPPFFTPTPSYLYRTRRFKSRTISVVRHIAKIRLSLALIC